MIPRENGSREDLSATVSRYGQAVLVIVAFVVLSILLHLPTELDHWSEDLMIANMSPRLDAQNSSIALVYIENSTLRNYPYTSPIDRGLLAKLIKRVDQAGVKVIGLDILLDRESESKKDDELRDAVRSTRAKMVLCIDYDDDINEFERGFLHGAKGRDPDKGTVGFEEPTNRLVLQSSVIRSIDRRSDSEADNTLDNKSPIFAEAVASAAGVDYELRSRVISWVLKPEKDSTFLTLNAETVLGLESSKFPNKLPIDEMLRDKIILIGSDVLNRDKHLIPLSLNSEEAVNSDGTFPGLYIHAQIISQIISGRRIYEADLLEKIVGSIFFAVIGFFCGRYSKRLYIVTELIIVVALVLLAIASFKCFNVLIPEVLFGFFCLGGAALGHYTFPVTEHSNQHHGSNTTAKADISPT